MKAQRKLLAHYLKVPGTGNDVYALLGADNEELTVEMGANVSRTKNVLGENSITIDSYEKSMSVAPYKADIGTPLHKWLQKIIDEQLTLDGLKTEYVDVQMWETSSDKIYKAYSEECFIEVSSYGGNTEGYQIPFNIHLTGKRVEGTFNVTTNKFIPAAAG